MADEHRLGLAEAVGALRSELTVAMQGGLGQPLRFELGAVEMEFLLEVQRERVGEAGVRFWVVNLGGTGSVMRGSTHRVKLSLTPRDAQGRTPEISDEE